MERILGLDLGSRTCGIAMSDALGMLAHGIETYRFKEDAYDKAADYIKNVIDENQVRTVVLGLPKHMNGDLGKRAEVSIMLKEMLEKRVEGLNVILIDERLTTKVAQDRLIFADVSRKKRKQVIDKMAAVAILQGYLDAQ